jgi:hypothetical protein
MIRVRNNHKEWRDAGDIDIVVFDKASGHVFSGGKLVNFDDQEQVMLFAYKMFQLLFMGEPIVSPQSSLNELLEFVYKVPTFGAVLRPLTRDGNVNGAYLPTDDELPIQTGCVEDVFRTWSQPDEGDAPEHYERGINLFRENGGFEYYFHPQSRFLIMEFISYARKHQRAFTVYGWFYRA